MSPRLSLGYNSEEAHTLIIIINALAYKPGLPSTMCGFLKYDGCMFMQAQSLELRQTHPAKVLTAAWRLVKSNAVIKQP